MSALTAVNSDMSLLYPVFANRVTKAVVEANKMGYSVGVFEAWRSPQRQDYLYAQGRTREGKIVTRAKGWESWHQFGVAVDVVQFIKGRPSWDFDPAKIAQCFLDEGLEWLGPSDAYHFQMTGGLDVRLAKGLARDAGVQRVWVEIQGAARK